MGHLDMHLIDEAMKKSGLIWVHTAQSPGGRALWHVWLDGRVYLLTRAVEPASTAVPDFDEPPGASREQPDPGLGDGLTVEVVVRSKDNAQRLISFVATAAALHPDDADWAPATDELARSRLNLRDPENAPGRWAESLRYRVYRLTPTGEVGERPGGYGSTSRRAAPVASDATTAGKPPRIFHRRGHIGRPLS